jgi:hypothetical protein
MGSRLVGMLPLPSRYLRHNLAALTAVENEDTLPSAWRDTHVQRIILSLSFTATKSISSPARASAQHSAAPLRHVRQQQERGTAAARRREPPPARRERCRRQLVDQLGPLRRVCRELPRDLRRAPGAS